MDKEAVETLRQSLASERVAWQRLLLKLQLEQTPDEEAQKEDDTDANSQRKRPRVQKARPPPKRLTGSYFGTVVGLSQYAPPSSLWAVFTGRTEMESGEVSNPAQHGISSESHVLRRYADLAKAKVVAPLHRVHPKHSWLGATTDGLVFPFGSTQDATTRGEMGLVEVKCPLRLHTYVPPHYMAQVQGQLEIYDVAWCDFVSWTPERTVCWRIFRSAVYWDWMFRLLQSFWVAVQLDIPPTDLTAPPQIPPPDVRVEQRFDVSNGN